MMLIRGSLEQKVRDLKAENFRLTNTCRDVHLENERLAGALMELRRTVSRLNATEQFRG